MRKIRRIARHLPEQERHQILPSQYCRYQHIRSIHSNRTNTKARNDCLLSSHGTVTQSDDPARPLLLQRVALSITQDFAVACLDAHAAGPVAVGPRTKATQSTRSARRAATGSWPSPCSAPTGRSQRWDSPTNCSESDSSSAITALRLCHTAGSRFSRSAPGPPPARPSARCR